MAIRVARGSGWLRVWVTVACLGCLANCHDLKAQAQTPKRRAKAELAGSRVRDVRSAHFLVHTDLSAREANDLVDRLETMLRLMSTYWGRPMQGVIECYVVRDLKGFPVASMAPAGVRAIESPGGVTIMRTVSNGQRYLARSVVYANDRPEVVQHEVVHAYCHHTFGHIGPVWYSEGMAEMGHYWTDGPPAVRIDAREAQFLHAHPFKSLNDTLSPLQVSGDSWQNYAWRWSLCHFLVHNPNYSSQFLALGRGFLAGNDVSFEQTFGSTARQLSFEYLFFLEHIAQGYRVDLCALDWSKNFTNLRCGRMLTTGVAAGRGWQPSGLTVNVGMHYEYAATGKWRIGGEREPVAADGGARGRGRLVGAMMNDFRLGREFELGTGGSFTSETGGGLYLRCRDAWNTLAENSGQVAVKFKLPGKGPSLHKAGTSDPVDTQGDPTP